MRRRDVLAAFGLAALARPGLSQPSAGSPRQEAAMPLIGFLHGSAPVGQYKLYVTAFLQGLKEGGFREPQKHRAEYRFAQGDYNANPATCARPLLLNPKID